MPIEIRELTIKVAVDQPSQQQTSTGGTNSAPAAAGQSELVQQCVDEVMEVLRTKNER